MSWHTIFDINNERRKIKIEYITFKPQARIRSIEIHT